MWTLAAVLGSLAAAAPTPFDAGTPGRTNPFTWDVPGGVGEIPMDGVTNVQGINVRMHVILSEAKRDDIIKSFSEEFTRRGYHLVHGKNVRRQMQPVAVAYDRATNTTATLTLLRTSDKAYGVVIGQADLTLAATKPKNVPPMPDDATNPFTVNLELATLTVYDTKLGRKDVLEFYRAKLAPLGFRELEPGRFLGRGVELTLVVDSSKVDLRSVMLTQKLADQFEKPASAPE